MPRPNCRVKDKLNRSVHPLTAANRAVQIDSTWMRPLPAGVLDVSPKRRQIVAAAESLFLAHGYGAVSMDAIAKRAGVSKATLYAHFASKDALFAGIMAETGNDNPSSRRLFDADARDMRVRR